MTTRHSRLTALLARIDQQIAGAEATAKSAPTAPLRQHAKMLAESLKLDREAAEKLMEVVDELRHG